MTAAAVAVQRSTADRCEIFDRCATAAAVAAATAGSDRDRDEGAGKNRDSPKFSNQVFRKTVFI